MNFEDFKEKYQQISVDEFPNQVPSNPTLSVCILTYNHENTIKKCLEGVLMQKTNFNFEIILGEDESEDSTREICKNFAKMYPKKIRLFLHSRKNNIHINGSPTGRFNMMYSIWSSRGRYIALCEGDDYWTDPTKLQKQVSFMESNSDFSLCFHNATVLNENSGATSDFNEKLNKDVYRTADLLKPWITPTASLLFRNYKDLDMPQWYFYSQVGDMPLILLLSLKGKVKYVDEKMSVYRISSRGVSSEMEPYKLAETLIYAYKCFDIYTNHQYTTEINKIQKLHIDYNVVTPVVEKYQSELKKLKDFDPAYLSTQIKWTKLIKVMMNKLKRNIVGK